MPPRPDDSRSSPARSAPWPLGEFAMLCLRGKNFFYRFFRFLNNHPKTNGKLRRRSCGLYLFVTLLGNCLRRVFARRWFRLLWLIIHLAAKSRVPHMNIQKRLQSTRPLILDGALGTLLPQKSQEHALWSTHTVIVDPETVQKIHESYIKHGAQLIQTSTYQTSENGIQKWFPEENYKQVVTKSIELAYNAKAEGDVFIAGSIGPYGASLANGAEYTGKYGDISDEALEAFHRTRLDILCQDDRVDLIALETIPNAQEIKVLTKMMNERKKPYYISLSVKGVTLADGTPLQELKELILEGKDLQCVGVNCLGLSDSLLWLRKLKPWGKGLVVYPNSGEIYEDRAWHEPSKEDHISWEQYVKSLNEIGNVKIVGGCCRTTPEIIGELRKAVEMTHI